MELLLVINVFNIILSFLMLFFVCSIWRRMKLEKDLFRSLLFLNTDKLFWPTAAFGMGAVIFIAKQAGEFFLYHDVGKTISSMFESLYITFTLLGLVLLTQEVLKIKSNHEF